MRVYDLIRKKRDGKALNDDEIFYLIQNYTNGKISDYQMSALLMAIYFNKMDGKETLALTRAMVESGDYVDLREIKGIKVDKHSTGGVGDTVSLVLGPMVAASGVPFVKMSGRGLGHTGGTLDKLEAIEGFRVELTSEEFLNFSNKVKMSICSQTANITPADKKIYSLRDLTATVENQSLIASSIMSKKLAIGSDAIILDVKVGSGAFLKTIDEAIELAKKMVDIGEGHNRPTVAVLTNMDEPLGNAVGNALEVKEAIKTLQGKGSKELMELSLALGAKLLKLGQKVSTEEKGRQLLKNLVESGQAFKKFKEFIKIQGGNLNQINNPDLLPKAPYRFKVKSNKEGFVRELNAEDIGKLVLKMGVGRETIDSNIDLSVGIILNKKLDDSVKIGDCLAEVHANSNINETEIKEEIRNIFVVGNKNQKDKKLILGEVNKYGVNLF